MALFERHDSYKCSKCGSTVYDMSSCKNCEKIERLKGVTCPCCKSTKISEGNVTKSNGIYGPGHSSWSIFYYLLCTSCGIMFQKIDKKIKKSK
jgi:DNA-directed RNA polymerase subunit RPC12/RpoP